jgi:hypothetical protein
MQDPKAEALRRIQAMAQEHLRGQFKARKQKPAQPEPQKEPTTEDVDEGELLAGYESEEAG